MADDCTFIQAGTGAVERTCQDKMRERVSPEDFGADETGVNDSAAAFNAMFAATGYVRLTDGGTYLLMSAVNRIGNLNLAGNAMLKFASNVGIGLTVTQGTLTVQGVTFDGASLDGFTHVNLVMCSNVGNCSFQNVIFQNHRYTSNSTLKSLNFSDYGNVLINGCTFRNISALGNGIKGDSQGTVRAIYGTCTKDAGALVVANCHFNNIHTQDASGSAIFEDADAVVVQQGAYRQDCVVQGCTFDNVGKRGLKSQANAASVSVFSNNYVISSWVVTDATANTQPGMLSMASAFAGVLIAQGNTLVGGACCYAFEGSGLKAISMCGNTYMPTYSQWVAAGITRAYYFSDCNGASIVINGNVFTSYHEQAFVSGTADAVVANNLFSANLTAMQFDGTNTTSVASNIIRTTAPGGTTPGIRYTASIGKSISISNNCLDGWYDGIYLTSSVPSTFIGNVHGNNFLNIGRSQVLEGSSGFVGLVGYAGNYSDTRAAGGRNFRLGMLTNSPVAGTASSLPATPAGYENIRINGNAYAVPLYNIGP